MNEFARNKTSPVPIMAGGVFFDCNAHTGE